MKSNRGVAQEISRMAWTRPRMLPMTNAVEADGMCLLLVLCLNFGVSKLLLLLAFSLGSDGIQKSMHRQTHLETGTWRKLLEFSDEISSVYYFLQLQVNWKSYLPFWGINSLLSEQTSGCSGLVVSSSATKEVVTLTRGNMAILET